jgi:large subunit ribosomal protein L5
MQTITEKKYNDLVGDFKKEFNLTNDLEIPKIKMVSLNVGIKSSDSDNKTLSYLKDQLSLIAGQKAVLTKSKKAISSFKLREDMYIGCRVTLRGKKMYNFLDKLIYISLPRIKDFRGLSSKGFNQSNHYSFGIKDHSIFLEVDLDKIQKTFGMNINIATNSNNKKESMYLLKKLSLPIK